MQELERDVANYKPQMDELEVVHQVSQAFSLSLSILIVYVFFHYFSPSNLNAFGPLYHLVFCEPFLLRKKYLGSNFYPK